MPKDYDKQLKAIQRCRSSTDNPAWKNWCLRAMPNIGFPDAAQALDSTFFADVSPLIIWQPADSHFLVETAFDLGIGGRI